MFGDKKTVKFASVLLRPEIRNVNKAKNVPLLFHVALLISFTEDANPFAIFFHLNLRTFPSKNALFLFHVALLISFKMVY